MSENQPNPSYEPKNKVVVSNIGHRHSPESKLFWKIYDNHQKIYAGLHGMRYYHTEDKEVIGFIEEGIARAFEKTCRKYGLDSRLHTEESYLEEFDQSWENLEKHKGLTKIFLRINPIHKDFL